jgi:hypothetical protein
VSQGAEATVTPTLDCPTSTPTPEATPESPSFADSGQRLVSAQSWDLALGDLDDDIDLDAFVANAVQGGVNNAVWLNDGQGTFTPGEQIEGHGQGVALGDVDGDVDLDALITNWWGDEPSLVWLNDGLGTLAAGEQILGDGRCFSGALGDLDGDGDLDAFIGEGGANTVWLNDGSGAFADTGQRLGVAITAAVGLGDLDGDDDLDALTGGWDEPARVWLNDGAGRFTPHAQSLCPASVHIHELPWATWTVMGTSMPSWPWPAGTPTRSGSTMAPARSATANSACGAPWPMASPWGISMAMAIWTRSRRTETGSADQGGRYG